MFDLCKVTKFIHNIVQNAQKTTPLRRRILRAGPCVQGPGGATFVHYAQKAAAGPDRAYPVQHYAQNQYVNIVHNTYIQHVFNVVLWLHQINNTRPTAGKESYMTISEVEREVSDLISKYSVYGVDTILKSIALASIDNPIITKDYVQVLVTGAFRDIKGGDAYGCNRNN